MKKKYKVYIFIFIALVILGFYIKSFFPIVKTVGKECSYSIKISKEKGVFIKRYTPFRFKINDTISIDIVECFAESQYGNYSYDNPKDIVDNSKSQVIIITKQDLFDVGGALNWDAEPFKMGNNHMLFAYFDSPLPPDTIKFTISKPANDSTMSWVKISRSYIIIK